MFDLKPNLLSPANLLSPEEQLVVDQLFAENEKRLDELALGRMMYRDNVAWAVSSILTGKDSMNRMVDLVMRIGDDSINIANLRLACIEQLRAVGPGSIYG